MNNYPDSDERQWRANAYCKGIDPDYFFPTTDKQQAEVAKLCGGCAVKEQCLDHAILNNEDGVWGGTTESQRRQIKKQRRIS